MTQLLKFQTYLTEKKAPKEAPAPSLPSVPNEDSPHRVSTRLPTEKAGRGAPGHGLNVSYEAMKSDKSYHDKTAAVVKSYGVLPKEKASGKPHEVVEHYINHLKDNYKFLYHKMHENGLAERASKWYDGAHKFTKEIAEKHNMPHQSVAAVAAAMSPQKDWHQNAHLAERLIDHYHTKQDHPWTPQMEKKSKEIYKTPALKVIHHDIKGKTLGQLTRPDHQAAWIRAHDEAHHTQSYHVLTPEGDKSHIQTTKSGKERKSAWGSITSAKNPKEDVGNGEITKAVLAVRSGGNVDKISKILGNRHKVRSFYNNIIHPHSSHGDVTSDTHHVAAGLLSPLGGNSIPVAHNFKNSLDKKHHPKDGSWGTKPHEPPMGASGSAKTGLHGTYPLYHEATERARKELSAEGHTVGTQHNRQIQSIVWEGGRNTFTENHKKNKKFVAKVREVWHNHAQGHISADQAREQIYAHAGGVQKPDWHRPD
jgi:hypothetical protein